MSDDDNLIDLEAHRTKKVLEEYADAVDLVASVAVLYERIAEASSHGEEGEPMDRLFVFITQLPQLRLVIKIFAQYISHLRGPEAQEFSDKYEALIKAHQGTMKEEEDALMELTKGVK